MNKKKRGRPTNYNTEILKKAKKYLLDCKDEYGRWIKNKNKKIKAEFIPGLIVHLPSIAGLAVYLKVHRQTIYEWGKEHKFFGDILQEILAEQEKRLIENGLSGTYNSNIVKLVLGKHGYHDKVDTDITSKGQQITGMTIEKDDNQIQDKNPKAD